MNEEATNALAPRSWRDLSQAVKPRAMSRGGRLRLVMSGVRVTVVVAVLGVLAWGVWLVGAALQEDPRRMPAAARTAPMKVPELENTRDGVLDHTWLVRTLELGPRVSLMELDLGRLRTRLLAEGQVRSADLTRIFPDRLKVRIAERTPIARVRTGPGDMVVASDGVAYFGTNYDRATLDSLPWLDGVELARDGLAFRVIADLSLVARLLADAQFWAPHLYDRWHTLSLARLELDREIEVVMKNGSIANFAAKDALLRGYIPQLANLDHIVDSLSRQTDPRAHIDLSFGRDVPVTLFAQGNQRTSAPAPRASALSLLSDFSISLQKPKREL